jgi:hypothetical protein
MSSVKRSPAPTQGGILSPLLANIALSVLDEHFTHKWEALGPEWTRVKRRRAGHPVMRLVRSADDFVIMVHGTRSDAEALRAEVNSVFIDEGFDFLGWRIQRRAWEAEPARRPSTRTRPNRASARSWTGSGGSPAADGIERSQTCCVGSTRCCEAGATTSGTACRHAPSAISTTSSSGGSSAG